MPWLLAPPGHLSNHDIALSYMRKVFNKVHSEKKWLPFWQTTFSIAFSWMKIIEFRFKFHWTLFPGVQLTISQHWNRQWLGAEQATSHYLDQCWPMNLKNVYIDGRWINSAQQGLTFSSRLSRFSINPKYNDPDNFRRITNQCCSFQGFQQFYFKTSKTHFDFWT